MNTKGFSTLVTEIAKATQATSAGLLDFTIGSVLRASAEAFAQVVLWLQALILELVAAIRASTSTGDDLDSWMADFNLTRLTAVAASGNLKFSRDDTTGTGTAPVGGLVALSGGTVQYKIIADSSNSYYSSDDDAYICPAGTESITIPGECSVTGEDGNADADTITLIASSTITGFDTVTNPSAFTGGVDEETDADFRTRFIEYLGGLASANDDACEAAIESVLTGIRYKIVKGKAYSSLADKMGYFFVICCNAAGVTSDSLLTEVSDALEDVVAEGIQYGVYAPTSVSVSYSMTLTVSPVSQADAAISAAETAINSYINTLDLGEQTIALSRLSKVAYDSNDYIDMITDIQINGASEDLVLTDLQMPISGTATITSAS